MQREPDALTVRLERLPGSRENRYMHLLAGEVLEAEMESVALAGQAGAQRAESTSSSGASTSGRLLELEDEVGKLREELEGLRGEFSEFKRQFE